MAKYRNALPQNDGDIFLTDGGLETTLIFHEGHELPAFAAFDLLRTDNGRQALENYYRRYAAIARNYGTGFIFESPTWRANASCMSHAELDVMEELDDGNPFELGLHHRKLGKKLQKLNVLGGCCGTDHRHVEEICKAFVLQPV